MPGASQYVAENESVVDALENGPECPVDAEAQVSPSHVVVRAHQSVDLSVVGIVGESQQLKHQLNNWSYYPEQSHDRVILLSRTSAMAHGDLFAVEITLFSFWYQYDSTRSSFTLTDSVKVNNQLVSVEETCSPLL